MRNVALIAAAVVVVFLAVTPIGGALLNLWLAIVNLAARVALAV